MGASYVEVPAQAIEGLLAGMKFERKVQREEVVYERRSSRNPDVVMKVFTSIRVGRSAVRGCGKDSIKVAVVFDNGRKQFGIGRFSPVFRVASVESVLSRLRERMVEATKRANEWIDQQASRDAQFEARRAAGLPADLPGSGPLPPNRPHRAASPARHMARAVYDETQDRLREKAKFAERERRQEQEAFLSDPDLGDLRQPPAGSYASVARMMADMGIMNGDEADAWKDAQKDASMDEPPPSAFMGE